jgi:tetratricopeptide (TPR) repeat protein
MSVNKSAESVTTDVANTTTAPTGNKKQFDFADVLSNMNDILKPVGAEVQMKRKNVKTGEAEECNQEEAVKITNFRIQAAAAQHAMKEMTYSERKEWLIEKKEEGNQYFQMKKYEKACEMYMQAISGLTTGDTEQEKEDAIQNIQVPLVNNLAACYVELGKFDKVAALSNEVLRLDPKNLKATLRMGHALLELREHQKSKIKLLEAIELSTPSNYSGGSGGGGGGGNEKIARKAKKLLNHLNKLIEKDRVTTTKMMNVGLGNIYGDKKEKKKEKKKENNQGSVKRIKKKDDHDHETSDLSSIDTEDEDDGGIEYEGTMIGHFGSAGPASNISDCLSAIYNAIINGLCKCFAGKRSAQKKKDEMRKLMKKKL